MVTMPGLFNVKGYDCCEKILSNFRVKKGDVMTMGTLASAHVFITITLA